MNGLGDEVRTRITRVIDSAFRLVMGSASCSWPLRDDVALVSADDLAKLRQAISDIEEDRYDLTPVRDPGAFDDDIPF